MLNKGGFRTKLGFTIALILSCFFICQLTLHAQNAGDLYSTDNIVGKMRYVPAGVFMQGSPTNEPGRNPDENQFSHFLTKNIAVMETAVTRQMWADLKLVQSSLPDDRSPDWLSLANPIPRVTWPRAVLFANLLSIQNGLTPCYYKDSRFTVMVDPTNYMTGPYFCNFQTNGYRLPTEGEREYFTRAGTGGPFSIDEPNYTDSTASTCTAGALPALEMVSWFCATCAGIQPVGGKNANPWNLKDVHGNQKEWCWDLLGSYPTGNATDFLGATSGNLRVIRGGACTLNPSLCRSAHRFGRTTYFWDWGVGFRLVRTINPAAGLVVTVTSPAGGESWSVGSVYGIGWTAGNDIDYVKIEYSTNNGSTWVPIIASTPNSGVYNWTVPSAPSSSCLIRVSDAANLAVYDTCAANFSIIPPSPTIELSRILVDFYAGSGQTVIPSQWVTIRNSATGILSWSASPSEGWLTVTPSSGSGDGQIKVDANPAGLSPGTYRANIAISDPQATNSPQTIFVSLNISSSAEEPYFTSEFYCPKTSGDPFWMETIDFDGDGDRDVILGTSGGSWPPSFMFGNTGVHAMRNDGHGNFYDATTEIFEGSNIVVAPILIVADFNGDGREDLYVADGGTDGGGTGGQNLIFIQTPDGHLRNEWESRLPVFGHIGDAAGDIDGDGDIDILTVGGSASQVCFLINDGTGHFVMDFDRLPPNTGFKSLACCFIDVDKDGDLDLFLGQGGNLYDKILLNDGTGHFTPAPPGAVPPRLYGDGSSSMNCVIADFDADGWPDVAAIVLGATSGAGVQLLLNNHDGTFRDASANVPTAPGGHIGQWMSKGDINNDGWMDIMCGATIYLNQGNANFIEVYDQLLPYIGGITGYDADDLDNDEDSDLFQLDAVGSGSARSILNIFRNIRQFVTATPLPYPAAPLLAAPADGSMVGNNSPTLSWNSVSTAISYELEVATDSNFSYRIFLKTDIHPTFCKVDGLDNDTTYYWRVRAYNTRGAGAWSAVRNFSVSPITIVSPDGGENWPVGTTHNITWTSKGVTGTATIDLYKNDVFNSNIGQANVSSHTYSWAISSGLAEGNDYKIKIYQGGISDFSDNSFSTFKEGVISGHVTACGTPLANVILSGLPGSPETDASGFYSVSVPYGWSGTATPTRLTGGYFFEPVSMTYSNVKTNQTSNYKAYKGIPPREREILITLYNSTHGDSWGNKDGWKTPPLEGDGFAADGTEGSWYGVTVANHRVTQLTAYAYWLSPAPVIPPVLGELTGLIALQFHTGFTGEIPSELSNLYNLEVLVIEGDILAGSIPASFVNLSKLGYLSLGGNQLSGNIPVFLASMNIGRLNLAGNQFSGAIPTELGNMTGLDTLELASNNLSGAIPTSLANLTNMRDGCLSLAYNSLYTNDPALLAFLGTKGAPGWNTTQTLAPTNVTAAAASASTVNVGWTPITYTGNTGGYRVYYSLKSGGPYTFYGQTASKTDSSMQVTGLTPGTKYYFVVQTRTDAHSDVYQSNTIDSEYSAEVWATTPVAVTLTVTSPNGGESWAAGSAHAVTWTSSGVAGNITIDLYKAGALNSNIGTANVSAGTYAWNIPAGLSAGTDYKVRIYQASVEDYSNADFTITSAAMAKDDFVGTWDGQGVYYRNSDIGAWVKLASPATLVTVGDLYGDGIDDLIGIWPTQGGVWVKNSANGTWVKLSTTARHIGTGDMNGDGRVDLLGTWDGQGVYYRNSMNGSWGKLASPATLVTSGDLDGDSKDDLIGIWPTQGGVWVKYSKTGAWSQLSSTARDIAAGDMNGDGRDELLATYDGQGVYYRNSFTGAWVKMATPADQVTCGDLDADGEDDLIGIWPGQGGVWVKYSKTASWSKLSSTAKDLSSGKMRAGGGGSIPMGVLDLALPQGGFAEGPGISGTYEDRSAQGPGGERFVYWQDKNLIPRQSPQAGLNRMPGPGEPGFSCLEEPNLIPRERARSKEKTASDQKRERGKAKDNAQPAAKKPEKKR